MTTQPLSDQARFILQLLAEGQSTNEILAANPQLSGEDIALAAQECLRLDDANQHQVPKSGKTNLRTYEVWTPQDDERLMDMLEQAFPITEISAALERHPATVRRRIAHLGLD